MDDKWKAEFAQTWIDVWNSHDLERIMAHYTDDFEMSSPYIVEVMNERSGTLRGKETVKKYWEIGLARQPDLHFRLENVLVGAAGITILYKNQRDVLVAEVLVFNDDGQVVKGSAYYAK